MVALYRHLIVLLTIVTEREYIAVYEWFWHKCVTERDVAKTPPTLESYDKAQSILLMQCERIASERAGRFTKLSLPLLPLPAGMAALNLLRCDEIIITGGRQLLSARLDSLLNRGLGLAHLL